MLSTYAGVIDWSLGPDSDALATKTPGFASLGAATNQGTFWSLDTTIDFSFLLFGAL